jgi:hypothetical protein
MGISCWRLCRRVQADEAFPAQQRTGDEFVAEHLRVAFDVVVVELDDVERVEVEGSQL